MGVPPIPHQEIGVIPPIRRRLGEAHAHSRPQPPSASIYTLSKEYPVVFRAGGWECPEGEIRGLSEQGRLMGTRCPQRSVVAETRGMPAERRAIRMARQTALSRRALPPLQRGAPKDCWLPRSHDAFLAVSADALVESSRLAHL